MATRLRIRGIVQGVGFRPFIYRLAVDMGLDGYVLNLGSNVEVMFRQQAKAKEFIKRLKAEAPPLARIDSIDREDDFKTELDGFEIKFSKDGEKESDIPVDVSVCEHCMMEFNDPKDRRHLYPFINCTDCGARFSLIKGVPYDRPLTSMETFQMCEECMDEYKDPGNRRFHAQTVSCPGCGPLFNLFGPGPERIISEDPFKDFAQGIDQGLIGLLKSWGGMHIVSSMEATVRLRQLYPRPRKPFALMVRDLDTAKRLANLDKFSTSLLTLPQRPVVIVPKKEVLEGVSDGLDNVGMYLPYSPIQHLLFRYLEQDAIIMTSANHPGQPMLTGNENALNLPADIYLLHDRDVVNRIDDTVMVPYRKRKLFIRRSRGFIPDPVLVDYRSTVLSLGAQRNVNASVSRNGRVYTTQYIGNTAHYDVLEFLTQATDHMLDLAGAAEDLDALAIDMHPGYTSRKLKKSFQGVPVHEVQHHFAHGAALMVEQGITDEMTSILIDGMGYGTDGAAWGGEVLTHSLTDFKRTGHLEYLPQLTGDQAVLEPRRMAYGIYAGLGLEYNVGVSLEEVEVWKKILDKSVQTSSFGRLLDALAFSLEICTERTYDGEPAMSTEPFLNRGWNKYKGRRPKSFTFESELDNDIIQTRPLFRQLYDFALGPDGVKEEITYSDTTDLCYGFVNEVCRMMAQSARTSGLKVGASGGVSYSVPILKMLEHHLGEGLVLHDRLPPGDGGISLGQNFIVGHTLG